MVRRKALSKWSSGWLNLDKPLGMTSNGALEKLRKLLRNTSIGHTGTLDPYASGVLPVAIGRATKLIQYLDGPKEYEAWFRLGHSTATHDLDSSTTLKMSPVPWVTKESVEQALASLETSTEQVPPLVSALHVNGRRAHKLVRQGVAFSLPPRPVHFHSIRIMEWRPGPNPEVRVRVKAARGAYVRALCRDLGLALRLRRTHNGRGGQGGEAEHEKLVVAPWHTDQPEGEEAEKALLGTMSGGSSSIGAGDGRLTGGEVSYEWEEAAGAVVTYLRRCRDGYFREGDYEEDGGGGGEQSHERLSVGLEDVESAVKEGRFNDLLIPPDAPLSGLPGVFPSRMVASMTKQQSDMRSSSMCCGALDCDLNSLQNGQSIGLAPMVSQLPRTPVGADNPPSAPASSFSEGSPVRVYDSNKRFFGVARVVESPEEVMERGGGCVVPPMLIRARSALLWEAGAPPRDRCQRRGGCPFHDVTA